MEVRGSLSASAVTQGLQALGLGEDPPAAVHDNQPTGLNLASLPKDVLTSIFRHGDFLFLRTVVLVCKRFGKVVRADQILRKRFSMVVFEKTSSPFVEACEGERVFPLVNVPTTNWPGRRMELHARFYCSGESTKVDGRLPSFVTIAVIMEGQCTAAELALGYFADGDVWRAGSHAKYPGGYGDGSRAARFAQGDTVSMLVECGVAAYSKNCIRQDPNPTCAVTFSRNGVMVHLPFLISINLSKLRFAVHLPAGCRAEIVASADDKKS